MRTCLPVQGLWNGIAELLGYEFPDAITPCPGSSCMSVLQRQLLIVFTGKQLGSQTKQWLKPWIKRRARLKSEDMQLAKYNAQLAPDQQIAVGE